MHHWPWSVRHRLLFLLRSSVAVALYILFIDLLVHCDIEAQRKGDVDRKLFPWSKVRVVGLGIVAKVPIPLNSGFPCRMPASLQLLANPKPSFNPRQMACPALKDSNLTRGLVFCCFPRWCIRHYSRCHHNFFYCSDQWISYSRSDLVLSCDSSYIWVRLLLLAFFSHA